MYQRTASIETRPFRSITHDSIGDGRQVVTTVTPYRSRWKLLYQMDKSQYEVVSVANALAGDRNDEAAIEEF